MILGLLEERFLNGHLDALGPVAAPTIERSAPLGVLLDSMYAQKRDCVFIVKGGDLQGIVTERDLVKKIDPAKAISLDTPVEALMTPNPRTVHAKASVARAMYEMATGGFRHLPVIFATSPILRVLSTDGIIDFIYRHLSGRLTKGPADAQDCVTVVEKFFSTSIAALKPTSPYVLHEDQALAVALGRMREKNVGSVLAVDAAKKLTGIFTERDYLFRVLRKNLDPFSVPLKEVSTKSPESLLDSASLSLAFNLLSEKKIRHIPIVNNMEELVGILSVRNFIGFMNSQIMMHLERR